MSDQPRVWCPVCLVFHDHMTDAQLEQLRAERDEGKRLQETERRRADAYSFKLNDVDATNQRLRAEVVPLQKRLERVTEELAEARAQLKAWRPRIEELEGLEPKFYP